MARRKAARCRRTTRCGNLRVVLEDFGIVGLSWRQQGSEALARFALAPEDRIERLRRFASHASLAELAYLETCNRIEIVFRYGDGNTQEDIRRPALELLTGESPAPGEAERTLGAWRGEGACEHLFLVAAGLDSAALGEADVAGQVRACINLAQQFELAGAGLALLFEEALRIAAAVRSQTQLGAGSVSLAEVAVAHIRERIRRTPGAVALVGVSAMTERAARSLADDGTSVVVVNRSPQAAQALAARFGTRWLSLDEFRAAPPALEAVLSATGSRQALLGEEELRCLSRSTASNEPPLCVDMAVPADIDAGACARLGIRRIGIDDIVAEAERNRNARSAEVAEARALVDAALPRLRARFVDRLYGGLFAALQAQHLAAASDSIQRLERNLGRNLVDDERDAVAQWATTLARRLAHPSIVGLKGLLRDGPDGALNAYLDGLNEDMAGELRAAVYRTPIQRARR